ncbi:MAG: hypothetical protein LM553_01550 [Desulfurococcaceae archaeon]|nr:hypothetical protein [Desulfurococcaceae archaeon]
MTKLAEAWLAIALIVLLAIFREAVAASYTVEDCTYLLAVLEKVVDYALVADSRGLELSRILLEAPTSPRVAQLHRESYLAIISYYDVLSRIPTGGVSFSELYLLTVRLDAISSYARSLQTCSHDPESSYAMRARVELKLLRLKQLILDSMKSIGSDLLEIQVENRVYEPGDYIALNIKAPNGCRLREVSLYHGLRLISGVDLNCTSQDCIAHVKAPTADQVEDVVKVEGTVKFLLQVEAACGEAHVKAYRFISVQYQRPQILLDAPTVVSRGEKVNVAIHSEIGGLRGVLLAKCGVNESVVANFTQLDRSQLIELEVDRPHFTPGYCVLKLCVNATSKTLPHCIERSIMVLPRYPRVSIIALQTHLTATGAFEIAVQTERGLIVRVKGSALAIIAESSGVEEHTYTIFTPLPVVTLDIEVSIEDPRGWYDTYVHEERVVVVNALSLTALIVAGFLAITALRERERVFTIILKTGGVRVSRGLREAVKKAGELIVSFKLGLGSKVAELYYDLVRKLGGRLPEVHETLREHFYVVVEPLVKSELVKRLMRRFMSIVEKDLYSPRRQSVEEAEEIYEGVLSAVERSEQ